mgnify:CR=1 FL=1
MNFIENFGGKSEKNKISKKGGSYRFTTNDTGTSSHDSDFESYKMCKLKKSKCPKENGVIPETCDIQGDKCKKFTTEAECNDEKNADCEWR